MSTNNNETLSCVGVMEFVVSCHVVSHGGDFYEVCGNM